MQNTNLEQEEKEKRRYWIYLLLFALLLFFCVFGVTYSIYKGDGGDDSELETGEILFTYSDVGQAGNGISLYNAVPTSDAIGKTMVGNNQYFDFFINTSTKQTNIHYQLLIKKDELSTLDDKNVRIFLSQVMGSYEQDLVLDDFSNLEQKKINDNNYYVLYEKTLSKGLINYSDSFRLRMWVKENAVGYENQMLSVKVDVYAYQIEEDK